MDSNNLIGHFLTENLILHDMNLTLETKWGTKQQIKHIIKTRNLKAQYKELNTNFHVLFSELRLRKQTGEHSPRDNTNKRQKYKPVFVLAYGI